MRRISIFGAAAAIAAGLLSGNLVAAGSSAVPGQVPPGHIQLRETHTGSNTAGLCRQASVPGLPALMGEVGAVEDLSRLTNQAIAEDIRTQMALTGVVVSEDSPAESRFRFTIGITGEREVAVRGLPLLATTYGRGKTLAFAGRLRLAMIEKGDAC